MLKHIFSKQNRALLTELVRTDFKLRYQGSVFGYAWSLLRPLFMFVILYLVFVKFLKIGNGVPHYPVYLLLGIVIWNFFTEMTMQSATSIVGRSDLIRKIRIPRWMIIFATSISASINLGLNLCVVTVFMIINHVGLLHTIPLAIPALIETYLFAIGMSFFLSALFVKFRDITFIWEVCLQAGFYMTPILYPLSKIGNHILIKKLMMLNPLAQTIQDIRYSVVTHQAPTIYQVFNGDHYKYVPFIIVVVALVGGLLFFKKQSKTFAENL